LMSDIVTFPFGGLIDLRTPQPDRGPIYSA
jgi:hypothetical protein